MDDIVTRLRLPYDQEGTTDKLEMEAADEIVRLRALLRHGLTQGYDCKGCDLCTELKAIHEDALRDA